MDTDEIKTRASESFAKGKFAKAGDLYARYCAANPKDVQSRVRMGDAWAKAGELPRAIDAYRSAAEGFAKKGFLPRAIAASKLILELDPSHQGVQKMLADLYAARGFGGGTSHARHVPAPPKPAAPPPPPEPEPEPILLGNAPELPDPHSLPPELDPSLGSEPEGVTLEVEAQPSEPEGVEIEVEQERAPEPTSERESAPTSRSDATVSPTRAEVLVPEYRIDPVPEEVEPPAPELRVEPPAEPVVRQAQGEPVAQARSGQSEAPDGPAVEPGLLTRARTTITKPPLPPSQPVRIVSHGYKAPPGLGRKRGAEEPAPEAHRPPPSSEWTGGSELQASFAAFSKFDELDLGSAPASPPEAPEPPPAQVPPAAPQAPEPAPDPRPTANWNAGGFTELELTGESLLHAVELAAAAALDGEDAPSEVETAPPEIEAEGRELPEIPLFSDLPPEAFIALFERAPLRRFAEGERVLQQGTVGDSFYVICEGSVRVCREVEAGVEKELAVLVEGSFFGEMALLSGAPRSASVDAASEDTQLLEISAPVLADLSREHPDIARALRKFCRQRMLANIMERSELFRPFDRSERRELVARFRAREVGSGDVVIQEGAQTDGLYVVLSGELEVRKQEQVVGRLGEGDVFGEMSLLAKSPATASVLALRRTSLLRLPRDHFDALIHGNPKVHELIADLTADRRRQNVAVMRRALAEEAPLMV